MVPEPDLWPRDPVVPVESCSNSGCDFEGCGIKWLREEKNTIVEVTNRVGHGIFQMNVVCVEKEKGKFAVR